MTPRWLNDMVRLYAICVGGLTLFLFAIVLVGQRAELHDIIIVDRGLDIFWGGLLTLFVVSAILMCCYHRDGQAPKVLVGGWKLVAILVIVGLAVTLSYAVQ